MDYRGGDEFVKLQTASEENSMTGRATNKIPEVTEMQRSWRGSLLYRERSGGKGIRKRRNEHLPGKQDHGQ
ncbi:hypothetical protein WN944_023908 [Citrus x changshan-huyou]|uniref:Uncharacterized protein n=1 Tax=Citrus x changshan-huyou TaxID=2935761 RepID=A0AAP0LLZ8_9ROSI